MGRGNTPQEIQLSAIGVSSLPAVTITGSQFYSFIATGITTTGAGTAVNASAWPVRNIGMFLHGSAVTFTGASVRIDGSYDNVSYAQVSTLASVGSNTGVYISLVNASPMAYFRYNVITISPGLDQLSVRLIGLP